MSRAESAAPFPAPSRRYGGSRVYGVIDGKVRDAQHDDDPGDEAAEAKRIFNYLARPLAIAVCAYAHVRVRRLNRQNSSAAAVGGHSQGDRSQNQEARTAERLATLKSLRADWRERRWPFCRRGDNPSRSQCRDGVGSRRILPVPARSGGGRLTEPTPALQPRRRERVKVPQSGPVYGKTRPASCSDRLGW